jgi:hypothetical protein
LGTNVTQSWSSSGANGQVVVNWEAPRAATTTVLSISPGPVAVGQSYTVTGTVSPASLVPLPEPTGTVEFEADGKVVGTATLSGSSVATATFNATAPSTAGNVDWQIAYEGDANYLPGTSGVGVITVSAPAPKVSFVSPKSGPTSGGTKVTITGTGFSGATKVLFGQKAAKSFAVVSSTKITAVSPAQAAATDNISVTTPAGTSAVVTADRFTY